LVLTSVLQIHCSCIAVTFHKPEVGEDTLSILEELHFTKEQISDLQKNGVIYQADEITSKL
jgi:crotonobetainyl-CoA:carnitine CoA-transferase CaiB-like acyl-CoA transferase